MYTQLIPLADNGISSGNHTDNTLVNTSLKSSVFDITTPKALSRRQPLPEDSRDQQQPIYSNTTESTASLINLNTPSQLAQKVNAIRNAFTSAACFSDWFEQSKAICDDCIYIDTTNHNTPTRLNEEHVVGLMKLALDFNDDALQMTCLIKFSSDDLCRLYDTCTPFFLPTSPEEDERFLDIDNELIEAAILTFGNAIDLLQTLKNSGLDAALESVRTNIPKFELDRFFPKQETQQPNSREKAIIYSFIANHNFEGESFCPLSNYFEHFNSSDYYAIQQYDISPFFPSARSYTKKRFKIFNENIIRSIAYSTLTNPKLLKKLLKANAAERAHLIRKKLSILSDFGINFTVDPNPSDSAPFSNRLINGTLFLILLCLSEKDQHIILHKFFLEDLLLFRNIVVPFSITTRQEPAVRQTKCLIIQHTIHRILEPQKRHLQNVQNFNELADAAEAALNQLQAFRLISQSDAKSIRANYYHGLFKLAITLLPYSKWKPLLTSYSKESIKGLYTATVPSIKGWRALTKRVELLNTELLSLNTSLLAS